MKAKTTKMVAGLAIATLSYTHNVNAQATVAWKQAFQGSPLHMFDENSVWTNSTMDTVSKQLYYFTTIHETSDFNPSKTAKNMIDMQDNANIGNMDGEQGGVDVVSCYDMITGAFKWANKISHLSFTNRALYPQLITPGNKSGLFLATHLQGKIKFINKVIASKYTFSTDDNYMYSDDVLFMKVAANGTYQKHVSISAPANWESYPMGFNVDRVATDINGGLLAAISFYEQNGNTGTIQHLTYKINGANTSKSVQVKHNDVILVKFDNNLNYITHIKLSGGKSIFNIHGLLTDAAKNIFVAMHVGPDGQNFNDIDLDPSNAVNMLGANSVDGVKYHYWVKFNPTLTGTIVKAKVARANEYFLDKVGNIYAATTIDGYTGNVEIPNGPTIPEPGADKYIQLIVKHDKLGNYKTHSAITRNGDGYHFTPFSMDEKGNIFFADNVDNTNDLFISKISTSGANLNEIWKNRIKGASIFGHSISSYKTGVYVTSAAYSDTNTKLKLLVSNPAQTLSIPKEIYTSFMVKFTLSGPALSPEEQNEEINSIAFKTAMDVETESSLSVFPNPATDNLILKTTLSENETAVATIYNYNGVVVKTITLTEVETKVELAELPAGMYFVEVVANGNTEVKKIIKQ